MKKQLLSTLALIFFNFGYSQVGINTDEPQATLDVNGSLRIETRGNGYDDELMLTVSESGIVNEKILNDVTSRKFRTSITVPSGETIIANNDLQFVESNFTLKSRNSCRRNMITSFIASDGAVAFIGGVGRDKPAQYTIETITPGQPAYSPRILIKFDNVTNCNGDGGNGTQFDFSIRKLNNTEYEIRNDGNVQRVYDIIWQEIL